MRRGGAGSTAVGLLLGPLWKVGSEQGVKGGMVYGPWSMVYGVCCVMWGDQRDVFRRGERGERAVVVVDNAPLYHFITLSLYHFITLFPLRERGMWESIRVGC